ncbi:hypothetical protein PORCAN_1623 [Porphyromonas crevioricanis JCM 13913]|nr:hypothetical protein PORCAN_1623 [Porphyromonas crevioricanis JCM 13913]
MLVLDDWVYVGCTGEGYLCSCHKAGVVFRDSLVNAKLSIQQIRDTMVGRRN